MTTPEVKEGEEDPQNIINGQEKRIQGLHIGQENEMQLGRNSH